MQFDRLVFGNAISIQLSSSHHTITVLTSTTCLYAELTFRFVANLKRFPEYFLLPLFLYNTLRNVLHYVVIMYRRYSLFTHTHLLLVCSYRDYVLTINLILLLDRVLFARPSILALLISKL